MKKAENEIKEEAAKVISTTANAIQETALATLRVAAKTEAAAEQYAQHIAKVGFDTAHTGLDAFSAYWESLGQIRREWVKQASVGTEKILATDLSELSLPYQKEVTQYGQEFMTRAQKAYDAFTAPVKPAAK